MQRNYWKKVVEKRLGKYRGLLFAEQTDELYTKYVKQLESDTNKLIKEFRDENDLVLTAGPMGQGPIITGITLTSDVNRNVNLGFIQ